MTRVVSCMIASCSYFHLKWDQRKYCLIHSSKISTISFLSIFMHSTHQNHSALFESMFLKRLYLPSYINKDLVSRVFLMSDFSHIRFCIFKITMYSKHMQNFSLTLSGRHHWINSFLIFLQNIIFYCCVLYIQAFLEMI